MSDMDAMLVQPFRRMLEDTSTPAVIRAAETQDGIPAIWDDIIASGFLDALVPENAGGAGLSLADVFPLMMASGEFALPVPFAETMVARSILSERGEIAPADASIVIATNSTVLPLVGAASHVLLQDNDTLILAERGSIDTDPFNAGGGTVKTVGDTVIETDAGNADLLVCAAAITAAKMAGLMKRMFEMALNFANEREQFGRPLGKFQAIQHQLALAAEHTTSAFAAARIGMAGEDFDAARTAAAKIRAGEASHIASSVAHAVHGAIGVTQEYDLQLYSRRLKQAQVAFGSERYWAKRLGNARLSAPAGTTADFVRKTLAE